MRATLFFPMAVFLMACQPEDDTPAITPQEDACGASTLQTLVGKPVSRQVFEGEHRIIPPNSAVTMDFRQDRLNVETDAEGTITRIYCG